MLRDRRNWKPQCLTWNRQICLFFYGKGYINQTFCDTSHRKLKHVFQVHYAASWVNDRKIYNLCVTYDEPSIIRGGVKIIEKGWLPLHNSRTHAHAKSRSMPDSQSEIVKKHCLQFVIKIRKGDLFARI